MNEAQQKDRIREKKERIQMVSKDFRKQGQKIGAVALATTTGDNVSQT